MITSFRELGESQATFIAAGGIAGIFSWLVSFPQDVIKTRLQADHFGSKQKYKSGWHCLHEGMKEKGPRFLFRGIGATFMHSLISVASLSAYSFVIHKWSSNIQENSCDSINEEESLICDEDKYLLINIISAITWRCGKIFYKL